MAYRWGSTALTVALLSLLLLSNAAGVLVQELDDAPKAVEKSEAAASDPVLRLPSDRSAPAEEGSNSVKESIPLSEPKVDHQEADGSSSSAAETTTLETSDPAAEPAIPSLKVSLIPIRRHADGSGLHRVHLRRGTRGFFWSMRPRHHSRLFHQLFLHGRLPEADAAAAAEPQVEEVHLGGPHRAARLILRRGIQFPPLLPMEMDPEQGEEGQQQVPRVLALRIRNLGPLLPMEMDQEQGEDQKQQQVPRVLAFRIRRLGPPQHHRGMMHDCASRKRLEALAAAQGGHKGDGDNQPREGLPRLVKRFTVFLNPQRN